LNLSLLAAVALGGCGKSEDPAMTEEQFCQEYGKRECAAVIPFCAITAASCEAARVKECQARVAAWKTTSANRPFRAANAEACLDKVRDVYSKMPITGEAVNALTDTCARVFQGVAKSLETCTVNLDCDGNLICDKTRCAEKKPVGAGALCANPGEICSTGESCKLDAASMLRQCGKRKASGEACSTTEPCLETLRCTGTCSPKVEFGVMCLQNDDCASNYCSPFSMKCSGGLTFAEGSDSCRAYMGVAVLPPDAGATD
jgi:hypothetical protein